MQKYPGEDWVSAELLRVHRFSLQADKENIDCLPRCKKLERSGTEVVLQLTQLPLNLRAVLNDRALVLKRGQQLFKSLILAVQGLQDRELLIRNIAPTYIRVSEDCSQVVFSNLARASTFEQETDLRSNIYAPYSSDRFSGHNRYSVDNRYRDFWCVGLILLEVLVGSELVLGINSCDDLNNLYLRIASYLDPETSKILTHLLFLNKGGDLRAYAS